MNDVMKIGAARVRPGSNALGMLGMAALVFLVATAVNCFGTSQQPVYYALEGTGEVTPRAVKWPHSLVVTRFTVRAPYDRPELVYRKAGRELRFYPFDLWAGKPGRMMAEAVTEHLRSAGIFRDVTMSTVAGEADFELRGEVVTIEELDVAEKDWRAHLEMRFELVSVATSEVVMRHKFDTNRPVLEHKISAVARVLDEILGAELANLTTAIDAHLAGTAAGQ